ncbi:synembryn-A [Trichonephila clavipes]|nr:synembryn-A [Trichonephila clavipes]
MDIYYFVEGSNVRLRSLNEVQKYCRDKNIDYDQNLFNFIGKNSSSGKVTDLLNLPLEKKSNLAEVRIPKTYREATRTAEAADWEGAMDKEMQVMYDRKVWNLVEPPKEVKVLGYDIVMFGETKKDLDNGITLLQGHFDLKILGKTKKLLAFGFVEVRLDDGVTFPAGWWRSLAKVGPCATKLHIHSLPAGCYNGCIEGILLRLRTYKDPKIPHELKFFDMRMLFVLTALCAEIRPKVRCQLHGVTYLMEVLDLILKDNLSQGNTSACRRIFSKGSRRGRSNQESCNAPCLRDEEVDFAREVLKVLFNLTVTTDKYGLDEEEEAHYMRLVSILHDIILCDTKTPEKKEDLLSQTINLLTNMPMSSYEELMTPVVKKDDKNPNVFDGMDMEAINTLLAFLEKRLDKLHKTYKEILSPILTTLSECARANSVIRKYLKKKVLPPLKDVMNRPEEGTTLRNRLVKLMTSPVFDVKELVADLLFVLCKENVGRLVKYTGYGNAAGLLADRGLMLGGKGDTNYSSDSEDSDTEEYLRFKDKSYNSCRINPVLGCYQEPAPNPMEGMTEEQKEYEAMQLVNMMDRMSRDGLIQPMRVGEDGRPEAVEHILQLQEAILDSNRMNR